MIEATRYGITDTIDFVEVELGTAQLCDAQGRFHVEKDFKVSGEVWRIHKNDTDPFPSRPHAHCASADAVFICSSVIDVSI